MNPRKTIKMVCAWAALCFLLAGTVSAKHTGSLKLKNVTAGVCLYQVADENGTLTEDFAQSGVKVAENMTKNKEAANTLQEFAEKESVSGEEKTPADGVVSFGDLEEGCYLVCSIASKREFVSFLVWIPTSLDGEKIYDVQATPKTEDPTDPTIPTDSAPLKPNIPQTGNLMWPQYVLFGLGVALMIFGVVEVIRGRRKTDE